MDLEAAAEVETTQQEYSLRETLKTPGSGISQEQVLLRAEQINQLKWPKNTHLVLSSQHADKVKDSQQPASFLGSSS